MKNTTASKSTDHTEINIADFFGSDELLPITVDGHRIRGASCRLLSLDEGMSIIRQFASEPMRFGAALLAVCVVDAGGKPVRTAEQWLATKFASNEKFQALVTAISHLNGLMKDEVTEELGNASVTTSACDSSSSSACASAKLELNSDEE